MLKSRPVLAALSVWLSVTAWAASDTEFKLALVNHDGQLSWSAEGYKVIQSSAKPSGNEIGIRGTNGSGVTFLGFLFLFPEQAPLTSTKCRDGVLDPEKKSNPLLKVQSTSEITTSGKLHSTGTRRQDCLHGTRLRGNCGHLRRSGVLQRFANER